MSPAHAEGAHDKHDGMIWAYALGYFLCYVPYSALTKATSQRWIPGMTRAITGFEILPISTVASLVGMIIFLSAMGWWKYAGARSFMGVRVPTPGRWTFLAGLCTAAIIATTTLSYTFSGISIVFMMLLMRGGVLVIAPIVDFVSRRRVRWFSWVALGLSLGALLVAASNATSYALTLTAGLDVLIYLAAYFARLRCMSHMAKSHDKALNTRFFVEEQMVATPAIVLTLALFAAFGGGKAALEVRSGFIDYWDSGAVLAGLAVGVCSQGTGVFGGLILLDQRENSFCIPVNRASSMLAGVAATLAIGAIWGAPGVSTTEMAGVSLMVVGIVVLAAPGYMASRAPQRKAPA